MLSVHLISGAVSGPPLSLALLYKGKRLPNRAIRCAIYATSVVYELPIVNCQQDLYTTRIQKVCNLALFSTACMAFCPIPPPRALALPGRRPPPPGTCPAGSARAASGSGAGSKGRSPLHKKTKIPPSHWEERSASAGRGWGQGVYPSSSVKGAEKQAKGRGGGQPRGQAPLRGTTAAGAVSAVSGLMPGRRGRSPGKINL